MCQPSYRYSSSQAFRRVRKIAKSDYQLRHVCPLGKTGLYQTDFCEILHLSIFRKAVEKIQVLLKSDQKNSALLVDQYTFLIISGSFLRMRNISNRSCRENQNTRFMFSNLFRKSHGIMRKKYCRTGQGTDENMTHAHCILDT